MTYLLWLSVVVLYTLFAPSVAAAAPSLIQEGKTATIATGDKPYDKIQASGGTAVSVLARGDPVRFELVYTAGHGPGSYEVNYENGGILGKISVTVIPSQETTTASTMPLSGTSTSAYDSVLKLLFAVLVLAIALESGLAAIFNLRQPVAFFSVPGFKPAFSIVGALVLVFAYNLDLFTELVNALFQETRSRGRIGSLLTGLVLAGASSGINNLFMALKIRSK